MKYELTGETKAYDGVTLHRIKALKDFGDVKAGDLGGWIECEGNLSQDEDCWVYDEAKVCGWAKVYGCPECAQEGYFTAWVFRPKQGFKEGINREYAKAKKVLIRAKANRKTFKNDL